MPNVNLNNLFIAGQRSVGFTTSPEAAICFNCNQKKCNGYCKKYKEEYQKLKKEGLIENGKCIKKIQKEDED